MSRIKSLFNFNAIVMGMAVMVLVVASVFVRVVLVLVFVRVMPMLVLVGLVLIRMGMALIAVQRPNAFERGQHQPIEDRACGREDTHHPVLLRVMAMTTLHETMRTGKR